VNDGHKIIAIGLGILIVLSVMLISNQVDCVASWQEIAENRCRGFDSKMDYCFCDLFHDLDRGCFCKNGIWFGNVADKVNA